MAEEAPTEVPVQAAEEQPVVEEPVAHEPAPETAEEPTTEATEAAADPAVDAEQGDAGLKRSREEEHGADGEEPDAKRAAPEALGDVRMIP